MNDLFDVSLYTKPHFLKRAYSGPKLWIKSFRFYELINEKNVLIREIKLKPGLNIIWGNSPVASTTKKIRYGTGHAVGKSLLCGFLRYALGENQFVPTEKEKNILYAFDSPFILAEIVIKGESWLVQRPLISKTKGKSAHATMVEFDDARKSIDWRDYSFFRERLQEITVEDLKGNTQLAGSDDTIQWQQVLDWMSRDQDCRLSSVTAWRNAVQGEKRVELANAVIRTALGMSTAELDQRERERKENRERREELTNLIEKNKYRIAHIEEDMPPIIEHIEGYSKDDIFPSADLHLESASLVQIIDNINCKIKEKQQEYYEKRRVCQKKLWEKYLENTKSIKKEIQKIDDEIAELRFRIKTIEEDRKLIHGAKGYEPHELENASSPYRCNTFVNVAKEKGCPCMKHSMRGTFKKQEETVEDYLAGLDAQSMTLLTQFESSIANKRKEKMPHEAALHLEEQKYQKELVLVYDTLRTDEDDINLYRSFKNLLESLNRCLKFRIRADEELMDIEREFTDLNKTIQKLREQSDSIRTTLPEIFNYLINNVIGNDIKSKLDLKNRYLDVRFIGNASTGLDVAAVLLFDCACIIYSLIHPTALSGFLLHDSPREADLDEEVYNRIIGCLTKYMATIAAGEEIRFQHIVTTTTEPQNKLKPFINEVILHADNIHERLLKRAF